MQQTKRRGKRGVILLALALALFVLAIVPAVAMAAPATIQINNVTGAVTVGSGSVNVTYHSDLANANFVSFNVVQGAPYTFLLANETARIAYTPGSTPTTSVALASGFIPDGTTFQVRVTFYETASSVALESATSGVITYNTGKSVSVLDWNGYGARGDVIPVAPVYPGPPSADYGTTWFGPGLNAAGTAVGPYQVAQADFYAYGALAHSIVYTVDDLYSADLIFAPPGANGAWPLNPVTFYNSSGIMTSAGAHWTSTLNPPVRDGFHWVDHYAVASTMATPYLPEVRAPFGWDSTRPRWTINGVPLDPTKVWYGPGTVNFDALATDESGSGVATATITTPDGIIGTHHLEWTWWQLQADSSFTPTAAWDALTLHGPAPVSFNATDAVGNVSDAIGGFWFDLTAPHTSYTSVPPLATSFVWNPNWTNSDVTVTFHAMDPGFSDGWGSGVDYTEYVIGSSTSTPPSQSTSGIRGDSVIIKDTAPTGPVYLWFRSVDKVGNKEPWQKIFVYIDKNAPVVANDVPDWWINWDGNEMAQPVDGGLTAIPPVAVPVLFTFHVWLDATDPNSGLGPDLIQWRVLNWKGNAGYGDWTQVAPDGTVPFAVHVNAADDGIYSLDAKVSDRAGNSATLSTPLKIDTRPPVTEGAAGWINGLEPYVLHATDQVVGAGVAATVYRVDQSIPWLVNANESTPTAGTTTLDTSITLTGGQGAMHTIDFGSVDAALPYSYDATKTPYKGMPSYVFGNLEGTSWVYGIAGHGFTAFTGYKTASVKLDVTAPVVTAMDPKNGDWQKGPATVNFSGTDVGSGYAYTEWSTDGGTTWKKGEVAQIGGNGEITVTYHGVDKVGIKSADQTIVVKVASTHPTVTVKNASVKKGHKATFKFTVTSVTPTVQVYIQIRSKSGHTLSVHSYNNVTAGSQQSRSFKVNLKKGKYYIRIGAVDQAGNVQTRRGMAILTVK